VYTRYDTFEANIQEEDLHYGAWLRASQMKRRGCNAKMELIKEGKLFDAFRNEIVLNKVRTLFDFEKSKGFASEEPMSWINVANSSSFMAIDEEALIATSDLFKRKLEEGGINVGERKTRAVADRN